MNNKITNMFWFMLGIALAIFSIFSTILFVWHVELGMEFRDDVVFTNGYTTKDVLQVYHDKMYMMFAMTVVTNGLLITLLAKNFFGRSWENER